MFSKSQLPGGALGVSTPGAAEDGVDYNIQSTGICMYGVQGRRQTFPREGDIILEIPHISLFWSTDVLLTVSHFRPPQHTSSVAHIPG